MLGDDELPDPASRHQPEGLRGPSRIVDARAFVWTDAALRAAPARRAGHLRAARRHVHARGDLRRRDRASARARARSASRRSRSCRSPSSPASTAGATTASTSVGRALRLRRARGFAAARRRRPRQRPRRDPRRRLQPRRRVGQPGAGGVRAVLHRSLLDVLGQRDQLRRRALRSRPRVGAAVGRGLDARLPRRRPAPRRDPRDLRHRRQADHGRARRPRPRGAAGRARHRRVGPQRPEGHPPARARRLRPRRRRGPTTSTTRCAC